MPVGKIQRKHSNETLCSMDSTIDSRLSSTDVPKMELLKINYVHQAKQALMAKTNEPLQYQPVATAKLLKHHQAQQQRMQSSSQATENPSPFKFASHKKLSQCNSPQIHSSPPPPPPARGLIPSCQPLPPPVIESWQFLQNKRALNTSTKLPSVAKLRENEDPRNSSACCQSAGSSSSCSNSASASESDQCTDSTLSAGCERSNSWDYRAKISTCDIRRDIARAGIKSRADRIAHIEKSECEHRQQDTKSLPASRKKSSQPASREAASLSAVVAQINEMFEQQRQHNQSAPPMKVPNARLRGFAAKQSLANVETLKRLSPTFEECCVECCLRQNETSTAGMSTEAARECGKRNREAASRYLSRIPKPITSDGKNRSPNTTVMRVNVAKEEQNLRAETFTEEAESESRANTSKPLAENIDVKLTESPEMNEEDQIISGLNRQMLRATRQHHKSKIERVHIRKKRQPLLIINKLTNEPPKTTFDTSGAASESAAEGKTCGYKNCNIINCPMSKQHDAGCTVSEPPQVKRLSLESNADSGVAFEDQQQQLKVNNLKNVEKCVECEEILRKESARSATNEMQAYEKLKNQLPEMEQQRMDVRTAAIAAAAKHADPNDVQNFAKKNLTKATTDELLTAALNNTRDAVKPATAAALRSKQCNIDNDLKNNENRSRFNNLRKQTIRITADDWSAAKDGAAAVAEDAARSKAEASSHISNDNCVTIFVRSAEDAPGPIVQNKRASSVSTTSFVSLTSVGSAQTGASVTASASSSSSSSSSSSTASTSSSLSSCSTASSTSSGCDVSSSGCGGSTCSAADTQSLCGSDKSTGCCCNLAESCSVAEGIYFNQSLISVGDACLASDVTDAACNGETVSCITSSSSCSTLGCDVGGVFWNSSCFYKDGERGENQCCCSLSSCDDDSCSCCEAECMTGNVGVAADTGAGAAHRSEMLHQQLERGRQHRQQQQQGQQQKLPLLRNHSSELILLRNRKFIRKTDAIHDLRPRSVDGGVVDSGVSLNGDTASSPDSSEHLQNQQDSEARRLKRGHVLSELLETERIYVHEMSSILKGYCDQMQSEELMHLVPASLQGKEDILFGNLHELYTFHNEIFLKDLENCISTTELVALCFVQRRDTFYRLYSFYCQNIPRSERLRETLVDTHLFLQECQKRLGHKLPLAAYLLKPVQRITKYQLLLKDLLRFSDSGSCTKELQKALDCMLIVLKCVNDSMHQVAITGFPSDLSQQGELLLQDSFQIWTESKKDLRLRIKPQQRHIFLYQKSMLFCKQTSKPGHNKSTYQFKHHLKMSQIGLTESVRGDIKRFEVWLQGRQEVHTLQAPTIEIKNKWVAEIKRVLLNQLEELKGEKIKQYGLNHRGLRQTTSWDTPNILMGTPQRTVSCDGSSESSNRNSNCSSNGDDNCCPPTAATIVGPPSGAAAATATSDKEAAPDACGWSSDYSNSEDEMSIIEDNSTPGSKFIALADYVAMGHSEVSMREGDTVELLKVGCAGWWFVRILETNAEGWTPAAYLESFNRKSSRSSSRNQERMKSQI